MRAKPVENVSGKPRDRRLSSADVRRRRYLLTLQLRREGISAESVGAILGWTRHHVNRVLREIPPEISEVVDLA